MRIAVAFVLRARRSLPGAATPVEHPCPGRLAAVLCQRGAHAIVQSKSNRERTPRFSPSLLRTPSSLLFPVFNLYFPRVCAGFSRAQGKGSTTQATVSAPISRHGGYRANLLGHEATPIHGREQFPRYGVGILESAKCSANAACACLSRANKPVPAPGSI